MWRKKWQSMLSILLLLLLISSPISHRFLVVESPDIIRGEIYAGPGLSPPSPKANISQISYKHILQMAIYKNNNKSAFQDASPSQEGSNFPEVEFDYCQRGELWEPFTAKFSWNSIILLNLLLIIVGKSDSASGNQFFRRSFLNFN